MRWFCVLAPVVLWSQSKSGTTGVAILTPGSAVLAMDSRVTLSGGGIVKRGPDECKIKPAGRYFVALAGLYDHAATNFDAWRLAGEAVSGARSVTEAAGLAEQRIEPELRTAMLDLHAPSHLAICVAGVDAGAPAIACRALVPDRDGELQKVRWEATAGPASVFAFGENLAIDEAYQDRKALAGLVAALGPVEAARNLVQLEIDREPERVGPPIAILQITNGGAAWVQNGACKTAPLEAVKQISNRSLTVTAPILDLGEVPAYQ